MISVITRAILDGLASDLDDTAAGRERVDVGFANGPAYTFQADAIRTVLAEVDRLQFDLDSLSAKDAWAFALRDAASSVVTYWNDLPSVGAAAMLRQERLTSALLNLEQALLSE